MKRVISSIILLAIIIGGCIWEVYFLNTTIEFLTENIKTTETLINSDELDKAIEKNNSTLQFWLDRKNLISTFIDHNHIQEIDETLTVMKTLLENNQSEDFFSESGRAINQMEHLKDTEIPSIENIL